MRSIDGRWKLLAFFLGFLTSVPMLLPVGSPATVDSARHTIGRTWLGGPAFWPSKRHVTLLAKPCAGRGSDDDYWQSQAKNKPE